MNVQSWFFFLGSIYFILTIAFVTFFFDVVFKIYTKAMEDEENINCRINSVDNISKFFRYLDSKINQKDK